MHFADRVREAVRARDNVLCVGIDPRYELLPDSLRSLPADKAYYEFSRGILEAVEGIAPVVKFQFAFFEELGWRGLRTLEGLAGEARSMGFIITADVKRSDIGSTALAYATAYLGPQSPFDAITISPYLGWEGIEPFFETARQNCRGVFVLLRTSNPGSGTVQEHGSPPLYECIAELLAPKAEEAKGECGYSLLGTVVGANHYRLASHLRRLLPSSIFLVPGYGWQGATAEEAMSFLGDDGLGALVVSARSVIYSFSGKGGDWREYIHRQALISAQELSLKS